MAEGLRIPITVDFKNSLQKLNEARKYFNDLATGAEKSLGIIGTSASAAATDLTPLAQAAQAAKASIIAFGEGRGNIEQVIPLFQELVAQAGGIDQAFEQLQDIPFFEEFVRGAEEAVLAAERLDGKDVKIDVGADGIASVKTQLREANIELQNVVLKFGSTSVEAQKAAARVEELGDIIEESSLAVQGADFAGKFELAGRALAGVSSAFQTVTALQAVFGEQSKETEAALKKVQAVMALTQGIQGIIDSRKAVEALGASGVTAFRNLTTGIATATGASRGLAAAIAATGIGLLVVGIGLAVSAISEYNSKIDEAAAATGKLREENERLGASLDKVFKSSAPEVERQKQIIINEEKIKDLQAAGAQNQAEVNRLRRENLNIAIKSGQVELATKKGIISADEELAIQAQIFRNQQELNRISIEETAATAKKSADAQKKAADELNKKQEQVLKVQENLNSRLNDIEFDILIGNIEDGGLEQQLKAFQEAAKQYLKLGFSIDSEQVQNLLQQASGLKIALAKPIKIKSRFELELEKLTNEENVRKQVEEQYNRFRELKPISLNIFNLSPEQRAAADQIKGIVTGGVDNFEEGSEQILDIADTLNSALADTFAGIGEAIGQSIAQGTDAFAAIGNAIQGSLGSALIALGKQIIAANKLINAAKLKFGVPILGVLAGVALVALGNILKAQISKTTSQGFSTGGFVDGPGTETSDSIPARLSKGEYVVRAQAVRKYGKKFFETLNSTAAPISTALPENIGRFARGGFITGPGTETSDSIPARLSRGEYVIKASVVKSFGKTFFDKLNNNLLPAPQALARQTSEEGSFADLLIQKGRNGGSAKVLVNRFETPLLFADGGYVGGLAESVRQFGRNGGSAKVLVNRFELPQLADMSQPALPRMAPQSEPQIIATTKVSGQDLKIILERAEKRYSSVT